jgi:ABC-type transport system involved in multi-copper enzyme maturation permease subunit
VIRSEWIKLRTVRSTVLTLVLTAVTVAGLGVLVPSLGGEGPGDGAAVNPLSSSLFGVNLAQLVLGVLGAVLVTTEFSTGQIRTTFTAVPKRLPVLWSKAIVTAGAVYLVMSVAVPLGALGGQAAYDGVGASVSDPGVVRALIGAALVPAAIAVMGLALGALTRHTATAVGILFAALFIAPLLLGSLGGIWSDIASYLPSEAGTAMTSTATSPDQLSAWTGFAVMGAWVAALLGAAAVSLVRRDP